MSLSLSRAAHWYADYGWCVVPLYDRKKNPRMDEWESEATTDHRTIERWWRKWPNANVGIAAGKSGLLMFDLDTYRDDYQGDNLITPEDEETITNLSGGGGQHLIYLQPEGAHYGNSKGQLPTGIHIRGYGGQFVVPPSIHPDGDRYRWEIGYGPHERTPLPLPQPLAALLDQYHLALRPAQFGSDEIELPDMTRWTLPKNIWLLLEHPADVGKRSETDQKVIIALVKVGATDDEIRAVFECFPIGTEGKFAEKGANGLKYLAHSISKARAFYSHLVEERAGQAAEQFVSMAVLK